jgi:hypothetical protein
VHETLLVEGADGAEDAVSGPTQAGGDVGLGDGPADMFLVEEGDDLVAGLEAGDLSSGGEDGAGAVGPGDDVGGDGEGVLALGDDEITVLVCQRVLILTWICVCEAHIEGGGVHCWRLARYDHGEAKTCI